MSAFYNEIDPEAAQWLRNLIDRNLIAPGIVDERSIEDITPAELVGYTQVHCFAGIGIWSAALRAAGWPDDRPVWTGSCPCQPFSNAGKGSGLADERHLWPAWFHHIKHGKPVGVPVFGEQVASADGLTWLDVVQGDMEAQGYTFWPTDLCAAGVGAPHIRQRLFFVAHSQGGRREDGEAVVGIGGQIHGSQSEVIGTRDSGTPILVAHSQRGTTERYGHHLDAARRSIQGEAQQRERLRDDIGDDRAIILMADTDSDELRGGGGRDGDGGEESGARQEVRLRPSADVLDGVEAIDLGDTSEQGCEGRSEVRQEGDGNGQGAELRGPVTKSGSVCGFWSGAEWIPCRDPEVPGAINWRAIEPGTFPLAPRFAESVGRGKSTLGGMARRNRNVRIKGYGNGIVKQVATTFIKAYMLHEH